MQWLWTFVLVLKVVACVRVTTKSGDVIGMVEETEKNIEFFSFTGIPYAKPPLAHLRFRPPEEVEPWLNPLNATNQNVQCLQDRFTSHVVGTEDCLVLNIFTPSLRDSRPVIVFIHGGGFNGGSGSPFIAERPDYFMDQDVVLVTINYRLGALGFLSTDDEEASGNYGLKDQVLALKWIKTNVEYFGGDSSAVTILGQSAGAASVNYLMLSPQAKGLFHRAILQSGSALNPWAITHRSKERSLQLAEQLGCQTKTSQVLIRCLRNIDAIKLVETKVIGSREKYGLVPLVWTPRVDAEAAEPFLPQLPMSLMMSGNYNKVPCIIGQNKDEGVGYIFDSLDEAQLDWQRVCKIALNLLEFSSSDEVCIHSDKICNEVLWHYSKNGIPDHISLFGDLWFTSGVNKMAKIMSTHQPVFYYNFVYESPLFLQKQDVVSRPEELKGYICHADEMLYLFKFPHTTYNSKSSDYKVKETMINLWTQFGKSRKLNLTGSDELTWPQFFPPEYQYLTIDSDVYIKEGFRQKDMKFWEYILEDTWYRLETDVKQNYCSV